MEDTAQVQYQICKKAYNSETAGNLQSAADEYRRALLLDRNNPAPYLYLGYALRKIGKLDKAVQVYSLAADLNPSTLGAWRNPDISKDIQIRSQDANERVRHHFTQLHKQAVANYQQLQPSAKLDRIYAAIWCATHDQSFTYKCDQQQPHFFYVPDLDPVAIFDAEEYSWCQALESAYEEIRDEYFKLSVDPEIDGEPYIDANAALDDSWQPLIGSNNWTSLHLYKIDAINAKLIALVPKTCALLEQVPLLKTGGQPREVLFSVLKGNQHIPPHYGLANTDMTVHLPLITSDRAGIKVAGREYLWQEGKVFLFDDSFLHESWNAFAEPRVNLLFGAWHPDLTVDERKAVAASFESREAWNKNRSI